MTMTLVMDCCAVDALLEDDRFARYRSAIESGDLRLLWTHVTTDELAATTDPEHRATLLAVKGDKRVAAELLGVSLKTVYNKLKEYQLEP